MPSPLSPSLSFSDLFLVLYHRLPTGEENIVISQHCSSSSWKSWRSTSPSPLVPSSLSQILFLILFHRLPTGEENIVISQHCSSSSWKSWRSTSPSPLSPSSISQIRCLILFHRLPTGEKNSKPALLKQLEEELEINLTKSLVTFLSLRFSSSSCTTGSVQVRRIQ